MSDDEKVQVNVEYCGTCGHVKQFMDIVQQIQEATPGVEVTGFAGRQASFEVHVNGELVYSKLQTLAFPDFKETTEMVKGVTEGKPITKIIKQQPITCVIS
ncbi:migration and invasion enhancer 1 [Phymastichus coffea]|uniref:migration and invasion enhancer 1 n=1 Tax=Phymastichus coffea TaxID=108790 RepID=UPI00273BA1D8|nr:migration and invasion enhancer 1 [Phymastichus coffea]